VPSTGSTIHTRLLGQALGGVLAFFRQQAVVRALFAQGMDQELVGGLVARLAQRLARGSLANMPLSRTSSRMRPAAWARCAASSASVIAISRAAGRR
jgi:hypothetical protein